MDNENEKTTIEHGYRLQATERLAEQHNAEIGKMREKISGLRDELNSVANALRKEHQTANNKFVMLLILVALLGDSALPMILKTVGL